MHLYDKELVLFLSKLEAGKLWLMGQVYHIVCFCKLSFIWTQLHVLFYVLSMAALLNSGR